MSIEKVGGFSDSAFNHLDISKDNGTKTAETAQKYFQDLGQNNETSTKKSEFFKEAIFVKDSTKKSGTDGEEVNSKKRPRETNCENFIRVHKRLAETRTLYTSLVSQVLDARFTLLEKTTKNMREPPSQEISDENKGVTLEEMEIFLLEHDLANLSAKKDEALANYNNACADFKQASQKTKE